jgi:hypothetical protein
MKKICSIVITIASIVLLVATFILQCPKKEDGSYMHCHNANIAIAIISCVIIILGILLFLSKRKAFGYVLSAAAAIAAVVSAIVPGTIISLCMMPEMTCRAALRPTAMICSAIIFIAAAANLLLAKRN